MSRARRTRVNGGILMRICITKKWKSVVVYCLFISPCIVSSWSPKTEEVSLCVAAVTVGRQLFHLSQALGGSRCRDSCRGFSCAASPDPIDQTPNQRLNGTPRHCARSLKWFEVLVRYLMEMASAVSFV